MTLSCSFKILNFETMLYNILKGVVCYFASELFKCLWAYCSERKCFRIFEMVWMKCVLNKVLHLVVSEPRFRRFYKMILKLFVNDFEIFFNMHCICI